jgi:hypothetical protein
MKLVWLMRNLALRQQIKYERERRRLIKLILVPLVVLLAIVIAMNLGRLFKTAYQLLQSAVCR